MKMLKAIPKSKIPKRSGGGAYLTHRDEYNAVVDRVTKLSIDNCIPIECADHHEVMNVAMALRNRGVYTQRRGTTLYASKSASID